MKKILIASFVVLLSHNVLYGALIDVPIDGGIASNCKPFTVTTFWDPVSRNCVESGCANPTQITTNKCTTSTDVMCFRNTHVNDDEFCLANQMRYVCMSARECNIDYVCSSFKSTSETKISSDIQGQCTLNTQTTQTTKCKVDSSDVLPSKIKYPLSYTDISNEIYCTSTDSETNTCYLSGSTCNKCPENAIAPDKNQNGIESCYLPWGKGKTYEDESGTFKLNGNCAYSGN